MADRLTHIDDKGVLNMVDVGAKAPTQRRARARGYLLMQRSTLDAIIHNRIAKGNVLATAQIAGIMAAKQTSALIPLCHPLMLDKISVDIRPDETLPGLYVEAMACLTGKTGVEMEALSAVSIACLTLYDMVKAIDKSLRITDIEIIEKTGGKSGTVSAHENRQV